MPEYNSVDFQFTQAPAILAYADLLEARSFTPKGGKPGAPTFSAWFLLRLDPAHPDIEAMRAALRQAAANVFGGSDGVEFPVQMGDDYASKAKEGKDLSAFRGYLILKASTGLEYPPALAAVVNGVETNLPSDPILRKNFGQHFYGGAEIAASFRFKGMVNSFKSSQPNGGKMVKAYLQTACSLSRGDRIPAFSAGGQNSAAATHSALVRAHVGQASNIHPLHGGGGGAMG